MRSLTFCTLIFALTACGDNGGTTDSTTSDATTGTASASSTGGTGSSGEPTTSGTSTTGEPQTGSDSDATTTPGETGDTTTTGATTTTTVGETSTTDATTVSTGETTDETTGTTGAATSDLSIAIVDAELWADCMPEIEADPVAGSWFVEFTNDGAEATEAKVISASLSLADADPPVIEEIMVSPTDSGPLPPGETTSLEVKKLKGAAHSGCEHCGKFYLLALEYQEGDVTHLVTEDVTISCAF